MGQVNQALDENPCCKETHVTFWILGDTLDPGRVTAVLGIGPTYATRKGELTPRTRIPSPMGSWSLETEGRLASTSLERHVAYLLDVLEPAKAQVRSFADDPSLRVEFHCYWMSETGHGGPILSRDVLRRIADLGAGLDFDLYSAV